MTPKMIRYQATKMDTTYRVMPGQTKVRIRFAFGAVGAGVAGFRRTHRQALGLHAVALAAGPSGPRLTSFTEVAPLALMASSVELLRAWVLETLGSLADGEDQHARLRDTLHVFLQENGSFKATAESASSCTRTVSSTGSARPRRPSGIPSMTTACTFSWRCWQPNGSAPPSYATRDSPSHDALTGTARPRSYTHALTIACRCLSAAIAQGYEGGVRRVGS
jgi:hypothetical protein